MLLSRNSLILIFCFCVLILFFSIDSAKKDRCIVITTHSMEEADALCSKIAIQADGKLRCLGSQLRLKNKFGSGYRLKVQFVKPGLDDSFLKTITPSIKVESKLGSTYEYTIPKGDVKLSTAFAMMEKFKKLKEYGVKEWEIAQTSLEEVFIRIATEAEASRDMA